MADGHRLEKLKTLHYPHNRLADFDEVFHSDGHFGLWTLTGLKKFE